MLKHSEIDASLRALAEPTQRAIIERLSFGPAAVSEFAKPFDMSLAAIVQHLQVLEVGQPRNVCLAGRRKKGFHSRE